LSVILWTPLHRATLWNHIPIIKQLHNKNANLNAIDENSWTPLHVAVKWDRLQAVELLITLGANVTIKVCFLFHNVPFA
jgi:ankyrin repeat protein